VRLEGLGQLKKIHLIGTRTCDLPACSIVPQPTTLPHANMYEREKNCFEEKFYRKMRDIFRVQYIVFFYVFFLRLPR
jgi:hypothetical protein